MQRLINIYFSYMPMTLYQTLTGKRYALHDLESEKIEVYLGLVSKFCMTRTETEFENISGIISIIEQAKEDHGAMWEEDTLLCIARDMKQRKKERTNLSPLVMTAFTQLQKNYPI
jgi:hypothetical protein